MASSLCKVCGEKSWISICSSCNDLSWQERRKVQQKYKPIEHIEGEFWRLIPMIEWYAVSNKGRVKSYKMIEHLQKYAPTLITIRNEKCHLQCNGSSKSFKSLI